MNYKELYKLIMYRFFFTQNLNFRSLTYVKDIERSELNLKVTEDIDKKKKIHL